MHAKLLLLIKRSKVRKVNHVFFASLVPRPSSTLTFGDHISVKFVSNRFN